MEPKDSQFMQDECGKVRVTQYYAPTGIMSEVQIKLMPDYVKYADTIYVSQPSTITEDTIIIRGFHTNIQAHLFADSYLIKLMSKKGADIIKQYDELRDMYAKLSMDYRSILAKKRDLEEEMKFLQGARDVIEEQIRGPNPKCSKEFLAALSSMNPAAPAYVPTQTIIEEVKKSNYTKLTSSTGYYADI